MSSAFAELERSVHAALESYSNVHRGSGHKSQASTQLYEIARTVVLEHLNLPRQGHTVVFGSRRRCEALEAQLQPADWRCCSSDELGLPLGVWALAARTSSLARIASFQAGGGTARLVGPDWAVWAKVPDRLEAGTPAVINVIAFARALQLARSSGPEAFRVSGPDAASASDILHRDAWEGLSGLELLAALRATRIGRDLPVPTRSGSRPHVNLDNGASTPTFGPIWETVCRAWRLGPEGRREIVRETRAVCADFLNAPQDTYETIFTSNTTEAIHLVADSLAHGDAADTETVVLNTILEHNSNDLPWRSVPGAVLLRLGVSAEGFVDLEELERLLGEHNTEHRHGKRRIRLVAVTGASNVLGTFNDLEAVSRIAHRHGARLLVDAAQLVAHRRTDMLASDIDFLAFSAHKAYAPFGAGVLVARKGLLELPQASRDLAVASGEENVAGIAALGKALVLLRRIGLDVIQQREQALTARVLRGLAGIPKLKVYGITDPDSPALARRGGVVAFELKGMLPTRVARELAERAGIGVRFGCHCAHLLVKRVLHVPRWAAQVQRLLVKLIPPMALPGVDRVSLGLENDEADVDAFLAAMAEIAARTPSPKADIKQRMQEFCEAASGRVFAPEHEGPRSVPEAP